MYHSVMMMAMAETDPSSSANTQELHSTDSGAGTSATLIEDRPNNETEALLHKIWCDVLRLPHDAVGTQRSFFSLGGDSVSSMQVASRARGIHTSTTHNPLRRRYACVNDSKHPYLTNQKQ